MQHQKRICLSVVFATLILLLCYKQQTSRNQPSSKTTTESIDNREDTNSATTYLEEKYEFSSCYSYFNREGLRYDVKWNVFASLPPNTSVSDVSIAVHMNLDRMEMAVRLLANWPGPISMAVLIPVTKQLFVEQFSSKFLHRRQNVAIHIVIEHVRSYYPVNLLRNVALQGVNTTHAFLLDVDFCQFPSSLYSSLVSWMAIHSSDKTVLVIPAFEQLSDAILHWPENKEQLSNAVSAKLIDGFHIKSYEPGHGATNFAKWFNSNISYSIEYKYGFEPYVVVKKSRVLPHYDERFAGYEFDKCSYILDLTSQGFTFTVLPDTFTIHLKHEVVSDRKTPYSFYKRCSGELQMEFRGSIVKRNSSMASYIP